MKEIKARVVDWWVKDTEENFHGNIVVCALKQKYKVIYSDKPDYLIYGPFGYEHLKYDCVRIYYTGEALDIDWNITDYAIGFGYMEYGDRYMARKSHVCDKRLLTKHLEENWDLENRTKFCSFVVSANSKYSTRDMFLDKVCNDYKKVDSLGRHKNNVGGPIGGNFEDKISLLRQYKFNICFENASYPGYFTEKLPQAFAAGCIPIYWGDTSIRSHLGLKSGKFGEIDNTIPQINEKLLEYKINPKAFINAHNYESWDEVIQEIKRIDNDRDAYLQMLSEPVFIGNFDVSRWYKKFSEFLFHIVEQDLKEAYRRPNTACGVSRNSKLKNAIADQIKLTSISAELTRLKNVESQFNNFKKSGDDLKLESLRLDNSLKKLEIKAKEKQLGLKLSDFEPKITIDLSDADSALKRVRNHLAYKLGAAMIVLSKEKFGYFKMPFVLSYIKSQHKVESQKRAMAESRNPLLRRPPLSAYRDYEAALKEKNCLTYKLGEACMEADRNWYKGGYAWLWFEAKRIKSTFK
ncbi:MAG: glycosyltransferase family 10 [Helicobacteraceae bacterium]|nr:glycosyltransferase family 10 [Helicobacteraceae bacterium]